MYYSCRRYCSFRVQKMMLVSQVNGTGGTTPSKPKIENAVLRGVNGETVVAAGDKVKFTAQVSDEYNDLVSFQLLVTMDGAEILNLSKRIERTFCGY